MTNCVDTEQTPRSAASDLVLHCLQMPVCPNRVITVSVKGRAPILRHEGRNKGMKHSCKTIPPNVGFEPGLPG